MVPLLRLAFTFGLPLCLAGVAAVVVAGTGAVAVTLESAGGAPQPTSTPLIVAALQ